MSVTFDPLLRARPRIVAMKAYESARSLTGAGAARVYLDANEFGGEIRGHPTEPDPQRIGFSRVSPDLNRYPEPQPVELRRALSEIYGVPEPSLFLGAGVDDAIDALLRVFCEPERDAIVITPPTYGYYAVAADIQGAAIRAAPLVPDTFDLNEAAILDQTDERVKLAFVCSPNNPTGTGFQAGRLVALAARLHGVLLVVDEAYIEFSDRPSLAAAAARAGSNLVVLRTLSKAWGMAGARLGAAIAAPGVISLLHKVRAPYPIARPAAEAGFAALAALTPEAMAERVAQVRVSRAALAAALARSPLVETVFPSEANFLLLRARDHGGFLARCAGAGIVVRDRSREPGLARCIRVSIGAPAEQEQLMRALE